MSWDGPIAFAVAVADGYAWAHCFAGLRFRCLGMGPFHFPLQLPMALLGPIIFLRGACCLFAFSDGFPWVGPINFSGDTADALVWAHFIFNYSCRWLCLGPLYLRHHFPMISLGPIILWRGVLPMP